MIPTEKSVLSIWHNFDRGNMFVHDFDYIIFATSLDDAIEATDRLYTKEHGSSMGMRGLFQRID
jgi:hypothetical protein